MTKPCLPPRTQLTDIGFEMPPGACDAHMHVFGPYDKYPLSDERSYTPPENDARQVIAHLDALGLTRGVLVTASACGTDNRSVLDALSLYPQRLRGIAVCDAAIDMKTLQVWDAAGIKGLRFNLYKENGQTVYKNGVGFEVLDKLAPIMADLGWHAQIWIHAPDLVQLAPDLKKLKVPVVIDHMGRMNTRHGAHNAGFQTLCHLLSEGVAWTKISGADRISNEKERYGDVDPFVQAILQANPEHVVWGTDWPHINYFTSSDIPDDGVLVNLLHRWLPSAADKARVLVENPARLYSF